MINSFLDLKFTKKGIYSSKVVLLKEVSTGLTDQLCNLCGLYSSLFLAQIYSTQWQEWWWVGAHSEPAVSFFLSNGSTTL